MAEELDSRFASKWEAENSRTHLLKDLDLVNGLLLVQVPKKKWYRSENSLQEVWDHVAEEMLLLFAESGHPIFRLTTPLSRGSVEEQKKRKGVFTLHY